MIIGTNPGVVKITLIRVRYIIIAKYLAGLCKLGFVIKYEDRLPEFEFN